MPPFYAYSAHRGMQRVLFDLKAPEGREAFLRLAERADVVIESFRPGVVDRLGIGWDAVVGPQPARRLLLDHRLRPGRPARAVGRARPQLPRRRRLPPLHRPRPDGAPPIPGATVADSAGGGHARGDGDPGRARAAQRPPARAPTSTSRSPTACSALMALAVDEYLATGDDPGRPVTASSPAATPATTRTRPATASGSSVAAIEPRFWANLCRALGLEQWAHAPDRRRGAGRDPRRLRAAFLTRDRDEWVDAAGARRHVRRAGADRPRGGRRRAVRRARTRSSRPTHPEHGTFRQVGPVLAGDAATRRRPTRCATRPSPTPTTLLAGRGPRRDDECAKLHEAGVIA